VGKEPAPICLSYLLQGWRRLGQGVQQARAWSKGRETTEAITEFFKLNASTAISVIRNSFTSVKSNTKLGKTKRKVHLTRYLDGSAAVELSPGTEGRSYPTSTLPVWAAHVNPCDSLDHL